MTFAISDGERVIFILAYDIEQIVQHSYKPLIFSLQMGNKYNETDWVSIIAGIEVYHQFSIICFAMRTAISAPLGLLAAKNSRNMGDFLEFLNSRSDGATFAKTDSRRTRY